MTRIHSHADGDESSIDPLEADSSFSVEVAGSERVILEQAILERFSARLHVFSASARNRLSTSHVDLHECRQESSGSHDNEGAADAVSLAGAGPERRDGATGPSISEPETGSEPPGLLAAQRAHVLHHGFSLGNVFSASSRSLFSTAESDLHGACREELAKLQARNEELAKERDILAVERDMLKRQVQLLRVRQPAEASIRIRSSIADFDDLDDMADAQAARTESMMGAPLHHHSWRHLSESESLEQARIFVPFPAPPLRVSLLWTILVSALISVTFGLPYVANEKWFGSSVVRGLLSGWFVCFGISPMFLINAPVLAEGRFRWRYFLCLPLTLVVSTAVAFVPFGEEATLGLIPICLVTLAGSYALCTALLALPLYRNRHHLLLDLEINVPMMGIGFAFFGLVVMYIEATKRINSPYLGLILPVGSTALQAIALFLLKRAYLRRYFKPKSEHIQRLRNKKRRASVVRLDPNSPRGLEADDPPPIAGEQELVFANWVAAWCVGIENVTTISTVMEVIISPNSRAWITGLVFGIPFSLLKRSGWLTRVLVSVSDPFGMGHMPAMNALRLVYLRAQVGCTYMCFSIMLCLGATRAAMCGDWKQLFWIGVNESTYSVFAVLMAGLGGQLVEEVFMRVIRTAGFVQYPIVVTYCDQNHPLGSAIHRDNSMKGMFFVFAGGAFFISAILVGLVGPGFLFGERCLYESDSAHTHSVDDRWLTPPQSVNGSRSRY